MGFRIGAMHYVLRFYCMKERQVKKVRFLVSTVLIFTVSCFILLTGGCTQKRTEAMIHSDKTIITARAKGAAMDQKQVQPMKRAKLIFAGGEAGVELYDNPTSRDFQSLLPLTLQFRDYNGTEKVADPPRILSVQEAPPGFDPSIGDLTLFAPWGNLAIFYRDFRYSDGLVSIGRFTYGFEALSEMEGEFAVRIESVPE